MEAYSRQQEKPEDVAREAKEISVAEGYSLNLFGEDTIALNLSIAVHTDSLHQWRDEIPRVASGQKRLPGLELAGLKIFS